MGREEVSLDREARGSLCDAVGFFLEDAVTSLAQDISRRGKENKVSGCLLGFWLKQ